MKSKQRNWNANCTLKPKVTQIRITQHRAHFEWARRKLNITNERIGWISWIFETSSFLEQVLGLVNIQLLLSIQCRCRKITLFRGPLFEICSNSGLMRFLNSFKLMRFWCIERPIGTTTAWIQTIGLWWLSVVHVHKWCYLTGKKVLWKR